MSKYFVYFIWHQMLAEIKIVIIDIISGCDHMTDSNSSYILLQQKTGEIVHFIIKSGATRLTLIYSDKNFLILREFYNCHIAGETGITMSVCRVHNSQFVVAISGDVDFDRNTSMRLQTKIEDVGPGDGAGELSVGTVMSPLVVQDMSKC